MLIGPPFVLMVFPRNCGPPSLSKCPPKSCVTGALFVCMSGRHLSHHDGCVLAGEGEGSRLVTIALDGAMQYDWIARLVARLIVQVLS